MSEEARRFDCSKTVVKILLAGVWLNPLLGMSAQTHSQLSAEELDIIRQVEAHEEAALALLERTVNINSGTLNFGGVREVGRVFRSEFEDLSFETQWVEGDSFERAGHLIARREGSGPRILLIGHLDTVFEADSPFQRYQQVDEQTARGPGTIDMKGGNVVMLLALRALSQSGLLSDMSLTVVLTGDEEKAGHPRSLARRDLIQAGLEAEFALGFEDGDGDPATAVISRRGSSSWTLLVKGTPAHSSQIFQPQFGAGAIFEASRILNGFRERLAGEELLTFNPGVILGGTTVEFDSEQARGSAFGKENVIAEHTLVSGDLRAISPQQLEWARSEMRRVVEDNLAGTSAEIQFPEGGYPPMAPTPGNRRLLSLYDQVSRDLGLGPVTAVNPRNAGAADISFVAEHVSMALDGLGLMGRDGHTVNETADLRTLPSQAKRAALLIYRLTRE